MIGPAKVAIAQQSQGVPQLPRDLTVSHILYGDALLV